MAVITALEFVNRSAAVSAFQGVATDGTFYYTANSTTLFKWSVSGSVWTPVLSRVVSGDNPTGKTQVNGISFENGLMYVGANDFVTIVGSQNGWVIEYDPSDLTPTGNVFTVGALTNEGGAWRNGEFFAVYNDSPTVERYNSSFVLQNTYAMPSGGSRTNGMYQSGQWMPGDILLVGWHGQAVWEGDPRIEGFLYNQVTDSFSLAYSLIAPIPSRQPQQVAWDAANDQLLIAERQTQTVARYDITYQTLSGARSPGITNRVF